MWNFLDTFAQDYAKQMSTAKVTDNWDEQFEIRREAQRVQREIGNIIKAVDIFARYGIPFG